MWCSAALTRTAALLRLQRGLLSHLAGAAHLALMNRSLLSFNDAKEEGSLPASDISPVGGWEGGVSGACCHRYWPPLPPVVIAEDAEATRLATL